MKTCKHCEHFGADGFDDWCGLFESEMYEDDEACADYFNADEPQPDFDAIEAILNGDD